MIDIDFNKSSSVFFPSPPQLSLVDWVTWPLNQTGKARYRIRRAFLAPKDVKRRNALIDALHALQKKSDKAEDLLLLSDIFVFLTWVTLEDNKLDEASRWLSELQELPVTAAARVPLRCRLMDAFFSIGGLELYAEQAAHLVKDPLVIWKEYAPTVIHIVRTLYEMLSPESCARILDLLNSNLQSIPQLKSTLAVCKLSDGFKSIALARAWANTLGNGANNLTFSRRIYTDAILGLIRVAEWESKWKSMEFLAGQACATLPDSPDVHYWVYRASLYIPDSYPEFAENIVGNSPAWDRLRLLGRLYQSPNLDNAEAVLFYPSGHAASLDEPEKLLTANLIEHGLMYTDVLTEDEIRRRAKIGEITQELLGRFAWADVCVAWRLIFIDRKYQEALALLELSDVTREVDALKLARVARLMLGKPSISLNRGDDWDTLSWLEETFLYVLVSPEFHPIPLNAPPPFQEFSSFQIDSIFKQFPDLKNLLGILNLALRFTDKNTSDVKRDLRNFEVAESAPIWVHWVLARLLLLVCDPENPDPIFVKVDTSVRPCIWELERWIANQPSLFTNHDIVTGKVMPVLSEGAPYCVDMDAVEDGYELINLIHKLRSCRYRTVSKPHHSTKFKSLFPELGQLCDTTCASEVKIELDFAIARYELASGKASAALANFNKVDKGLQTASLITKAWWMPTLKYWRAVVKAHLHDNEATPLLESLADGFKWEEACSQLALLALQENRIAEAVRWLKDLREGMPAVAYARALIHERQGEYKEAITILEMHGIFEGSSYAIPALRLLAALAEREKHWQEAEQYNRELLLSYPDDPVASARLGRLLLRRMYLAEESNVENKYWVESLLSRGAQAALWVEVYQCLFKILTAPVCDLPKFERTIDSQEREIQLNFYILLARRYLAERHPKSAKLLIERYFANDPSIAHAQYVLEIWDVITRIGDLISGAQLVRGDANIEINNLVKDLQRHALNLSKCNSPANDKSLHWNHLADLTLRTCNSDQVAFLNRLASTTQHDDWVFWTVLDLWSESTEIRFKTAERLKEYLELNIPGYWSDLQWTTLNALASWAVGDDTSFLDDYALLKDRLDELPVDGRDLWFAAASIRFRRHDWKELTDGELPSCVEDLAYPKARLIIGLAYARAAADAKDTRKADAFVRQAREMLSALIPIPN